MKEGAFRGRKFMGSTLPLPEGFCGITINPMTSVYVLNSKQVDGFCFHMPQLCGSSL